MTYTPTYPGGWVDSPSTTTPITAAALTNMDNGILGVQAVNPSGPSELGFAAWTYNPLLLINTPTGVALPTAGVVFLWKMTVAAAVSVTNIRVNMITAGATLTTGQNFAGLIDSTGAKIATTGDMTTTWTGATGLIDMPLTSGPFTVNPPFCWAAFVFNGTTGPSFMRTTNISAAYANGKLTAANTKYGSILTGQTAIPASITPASISTNPQTYWAAIW
jgi:hypothetical protein